MARPRQEGLTEEEIEQFANRLFEEEQAKGAKKAKEVDKSSLDLFLLLVGNYREGRDPLAITKEEDREKLWFGAGITPEDDRSSSLGKAFYGLSKLNRDFGKSDNEEYQKVFLWLEEVIAEEQKAENSNNAPTAEDGESKKEGVNNGWDEKIAEDAKKKVIENINSRGGIETAVTVFLKAEGVESFAQKEAKKWDPDFGKNPDLSKRKWSKKFIVEQVAKQKLGKNFEEAVLRGVYDEICGQLIEELDELQKEHYSAYKEIVVRYLGMVLTSVQGKLHPDYYGYLVSLILGGREQVTPSEINQWLAEVNVALNEELIEKCRVLLTGDEMRKEVLDAVMEKVRQQEELVLLKQVAEREALGQNEQSQEEVKSEITDGRQTDGQRIWTEWMVPIIAPVANLYPKESVKSLVGRLLTTREEDTPEEAAELFGLSPDDVASNRQAWEGFDREVKRQILDAVTLEVEQLRKAQNEQQQEETRKEGILTRGENQPPALSLEEQEEQDMKKAIEESLERQQEKETRSNVSELEEELYQKTIFESLQPEQPIAATIVQYHEVFFGKEVPTVQLHASKRLFGMDGKTGKEAQEIGRKNLEEMREALQNERQALNKKSEEEEKVPDESYEEIEKAEEILNKAAELLFPQSMTKATQSQQLAPNQRGQEKG